MNHIRISLHHSVLVRTPFVDSVGYVTGLSNENGGTTDAAQRFQLYQVGVNITQLCGNYALIRCHRKRPNPDDG